MPEPRKRSGARRARSQARETAETNIGPPDPPESDSEAIVLVDTVLVDTVLVDTVSVDTTEQPAVVEESDVPEKVIAETDYPTVESQQDIGTAIEHSNGEGIERLFHDPEFMDQVVSKLVGDDKTMDSLAGEFAEKLGNVLEDSQEFRQRLLKAAVSTETFRGKLIRSLAEALD